MHPILNIAQKAARQAGKIILRALDRLDTVTVSEKTKNDFVTDIDRQSEREIIYHIRKAYPDHGILAEESGEAKGDDYQWVIDPLDGTANFIHGIPHFAISIAHMHKNQVEHGLIYDPVHDEIFTASRGAGCQLNNRRIRVSTQQKMDKSLLATGLPFRSRHLLETYMKTYQELAQQAGDIRRFASATLDLAYVAAGRLDGYWEFDLAPWDLAAGTLMVKEAGGYVSDFAGKDEFLQNGNIIAGNPKIYATIFDAISKMV